MKNKRSDDEGNAPLWFAYAVICFICASAIAWIERAELMRLL